MRLGLYSSRIQREGYRAGIDGPGAGAGNLELEEVWICPLSRIMYLRIASVRGHNKGRVARVWQVG